MKCEVCGSAGTRIQLLTGPGKPFKFKFLCAKHKKGFREFRRNQGK